MDIKPIDLNQPIYLLCKQYPELITMMESIGFKDITAPGMLSSAGKFMTIPKGAVLKKLDIEQIKRQLADGGFSVIEQEVKI